jgi:peptidoglycan-associated lipoprotein
MKKLLLVALIALIIPGIVACQKKVAGQPVVSPPVASKTTIAPPQGVVAVPEFVSSKIYFDFDKYLLTQESITNLNKKGEWLKANPSTKVIIEGHCDERGTNEYNMALGERRANAAKKYLVDSGISADRIKTISYGEEKPVCKEKTEACWKQNRNDTFIVTK